jgi:hypothetical protein
MIIFKKKDEPVYVVTNYKVMYSSLNAEPSLEKITKSGLTLILAVLRSWFGSSCRFYMVVRDPYDRVESFYKSKFARGEINRIWMEEQGMKARWQDCTLPFFPLLDLDTSMDPSMIGKRLVATSFDEMVTLLPKVYLMDGHMTPQNFAKVLSFELLGVKFRLPIRFKSIYKLEEQEDLEALKRNLHIDLSVRNSTRNMKEGVTWTQSSQQIVEKLYEKDFRLYQYDTKSGLQ